MKINNCKTIFLVAGGTGGHVFPAETLGIILKNHDYDVHILIDDRAKKFINHFSSDRIHIISSSSLKKKNLFQKGSSILKIIKGMWQSYWLIKKFNPILIGGFGGYPTIPTLCIGIIFRISTFIHEQNAILGRANHFLASYVNAIAGAFPINLKKYSKKFFLTGIPVRNSIIKAASSPYYPSFGNMPFYLLVFGGSQGATFFSEIIPKALCLLERFYLDRLVIIHQARLSEISLLKEKYKNLKIKFYVKPFFKNIADLMVKANYIISRSGASTIAEISVIGRPALLVPYPNSLDNDQKENAKKFFLSGGVEIFQEKDATAFQLSLIISKAMLEPNRLEIMAKQSNSLVNVNASKSLLSLIKSLIQKNSFNEFKGDSL